MPENNFPQKAPKKLNKILLSATVGLVLLAVVVTMVFWKKGSGNGGGGDDDTSIAPFIPIWVAVFIPLFARRKKEPLTGGRKKIVIAALILTALLVLGTLVFVLMAR